MSKLDKDYFRNGPKAGGSLSVRLFFFTSLRRCRYQLKDRRVRLIGAVAGLRLIIAEETVDGVERDGGDRGGG
jgi:hypothetical protein